MGAPMMRPSYDEWRRLRNNGIGADRIYERIRAEAEKAFAEAVSEEEELRVEWLYRRLLTTESGYVRPSALFNRPCPDSLLAPSL